MTSLKEYLNIALLAGVCAGIAGCKEDYIPAPITDGWRHEKAKESLYTVQSDDTIYSIAWAFDLDYRHLAQINHLAPPYSLSQGQKLRIYHGQLEAQTHAIAEAAQFIEEKIEMTEVEPHPLQHEQALPFEESEELVIRPQQSKQPTVQHEEEHPHSAPHQLKPVQQHLPQPKADSVIKVPAVISAKGWQWPAQGKMVQGFSRENGALRGIDIAGSEGSPVLATRAGKVVYSGNGLRGYGKLLIIKHNDEFLSAYAHNHTLLVREGQQVRQGQEIATMGKTGAGSVKLHFEIRRAGKPIDPLHYLKVS